MELIKDIPFCSNANRQFKLDLCIPASVDNRAVRKHIKFKNIKIVKTEKSDNSLKIRGNKRTVTKRYTNSRGDSPTEFRQEQAVKDTVYPNTDNELDETRPSAKKGKAPFVIFVHGGGWRRGGKEAWKHYLYHDVNFLVAILQWLLNVHRNVGFSLAKSGIGCALISYPLTEQDLPYVFVEMLLSYIQSCFVTFLGLFPIGLLIYLLQMHGTIRTPWIHVITGTRYDIRLSGVFLVLFTTNIISLIIFTVKRDKFKVPFLHISLLWVIILSTFIWINLLTRNYQLIFFTLLTFVITQLVILRRRLSRREITYADQAKVVARAVHWVKRLARKSGQFDREKIYLMGHSAGGHLVTLTVLDEFYLKDACCSVQDIRVQY